MVPLDFLVPVLQFLTCGPLLLECLNNPDLMVVCLLSVCLLASAFSLGGFLQLIPSSLASHYQWPIGPRWLMAVISRTDDLFSMHQAVDPIA